MKRPAGKSWFVWNLANFISATRFSTPIILFVLPLFFEMDLITKLLIFAALTATDAIDGPIAKLTGNYGYWGKIIDMAADKVLQLSGFAFLIFSGLCGPFQKILAIFIVFQEARIAALAIEGANLVAEKAFREKAAMSWRARYVFAFSEVITGFIAEINANQPGKWKMVAYALGVYFMVWDYFNPHIVNYWYSILCFSIGIYLSFVARRKYKYDFEKWKHAFLSK